MQSVLQLSGVAGGSWLESSAIFGLGYALAVLEARLVVFRVVKLEVWLEGSLV